MKSSRSQSSKNIRRNARKLMSESSDESDSFNKYSADDDSAQAERVFSRRTHQKRPLNLDRSTNESMNISTDRTLFRVSDSSESDLSQSATFDEKKSADVVNEYLNSTSQSIVSEKPLNKSLMTDEEYSSDNSLNMACSMKSSKTNRLDYRSFAQSSDDDQLQNSTFHISDDSAVNDSFAVAPKKRLNKLVVISDLSDESDIEKISPENVNKNFVLSSSSDESNIKERTPKSNIDETTNKKMVNEYLKSTNKSTVSEKPLNMAYSMKSSKTDRLDYRSFVQSSDDDQLQNSTFHISDDSAVNDSFAVAPKKRLNKLVVISDLSDESDIEKTSPETMNKKKINKNFILSSSSDESIIKEVTSKSNVNETILISASDSDEDIINSSNETNLHYKSTISSSCQNRPFVEDFKFLNTSQNLQGPMSQSSILQNPNFNISTENTSNDCKIEEKSEIESLGDNNSKNVSSPKQNQPILIDLTEKRFDEKSFSTLPNTSNQLKNQSVDRIESLKMEKNRLEEVMQQYSKNIYNMKHTLSITNLQLLPDGGIKLKQAISKEENRLKDTVMQHRNVLNKLKEFKDSNLKLQEENTKSTHFYPLKPSNLKDALTKRAAADIDIGAMGDKALSTYRAQQAMTLDILHSLHKSLETCPTSDILADDPSGLKIELMPHQKHGIAWLMWRESQKPHGGILADDMGLGKTLTMIALTVKSSEKKEEDSDSDNSLNGSSINTIKGGTLIICPSSLISQWQNEIKTKLRPRTLDVVQHYGPNRESSAKRLGSKDVVITTYHVVMWDHKNTKSPLFRIKWKRIILDEAHTIRNPKSQTSIAVSALSGINRWALTGTPIHNKEADFYALLKFIKCSPFDDWAVWKRWVGNNDEAGKNRLSLLVKTLMLRRTKAELIEVSSFKLPTKNFHTVFVELFKEEKAVYEKVLLFSSTLFASYLYDKAEKENAVGHGFPVHNKAKYLHQQNLAGDVFQDHPELNELFKKLKNRKEIQAHHILVLILRLRQLCCHPCLMRNMLDGENLKAEGITDTGDLDLVDHMSRMSIGIPSIEDQSPLTNANPIFKDSWVSSKVKAICDMVEEKVLHTNDKAVIVSQWPSMLLLIQKQLSRYHVKTEIFSGAVPVLNRNKIVSEFNSPNGGPKILLLSLTAGGVGLNLIAANHMFLVDIHWNPQLEAQACDRIYRVGQTKEVNIYKFICSDTIEKSIQSIQLHKIQIANNVFGGCRNSVDSKITLDDLKEIFSINPKK